MMQARESAHEFGHEYIGTEHMLVGLCANPECAASRALRERGLDVTELSEQVGEIVKKGKAETTGALPFTPDAKRALEESMAEASAMGDDYIGTEHLLLGLIAATRGVASRVLLSHGVDARAARDAVARLHPPDDELD